MPVLPSLISMQWSPSDWLQQNLIPTSNDLDNIDLRGQMMLSTLHAGLAFSNASLGLIHAMAHSLGVSWIYPMESAMHILLDQVIDFNFES